MFCLAALLSRHPLFLIMPAPHTHHAGNEFIQLIVFVFMFDTVDLAMDWSNYGEKSKPDGIFASNGFLASFTASLALATASPLHHSTTLSLPPLAAAASHVQSL